MNDRAQVGVWALLARVRQLRVERARRRLNEARFGVERAAAETACQRNATVEHDTRRGEILAACSSRERGALLWRLALRRHDSGRGTLETALAVAYRVEERAKEQVITAAHLLQKEMHRLDYVREHARRLAIARQDDSNSDD